MVFQRQCFHSGPPGPSPPLNSSLAVPPLLVLLKARCPVGCECSRQVPTRPASALPSGVFRCPDLLPERFFRPPHLNIVVPSPRCGACPCPLTSLFSNGSQNHLASFLFIWLLSFQPPLESKLHKRRNCLVYILSCGTRWTLNERYLKKSLSEVWNTLGFDASVEHSCVWFVLCLHQLHILISPIVQYVQSCHVPGTVLNAGTHSEQDKLGFFMELPFC